MPSIVQAPFFFEKKAAAVYYSGLDGLDYLPEKPGWYAWIQVPITVDDLHLSLCRPQSMVATIEADLGLRFQGTVRPVESTIEDPKAAEFLSLRLAMLFFAPPLYVGIAKDLRSRLLSHRQHLREPPSHVALTVEQMDTEYESRCFGLRMSKALDFRTGASGGDGNSGVNNRPAVRADSLIVKCVLAPSGNRRRLKSVESVLNRLYAPPYGRKA